MTLFSTIFCCFKWKKDKNSWVDAGSLSKKSTLNIQPSAAPIVVSYFPVNSQPSRL
ncbi:hypothetical protein TanjilG_26967 [Lupinus angustifolius]|uniref:Uncharacterized protein n=1 Tax=Lupinus angustifolius TaxID=3871 RepID=A0A1J7IA76_LUPAN|nr:hypothetical protein TanjilG_26967 [Lupinus angustifolius]